MSRSNDSAEESADLPETLFAHQRAAYRALRRVARGFFDPGCRSLPVRPRSNQLIVGPTGVGKTEIARLLARELSVPFLELVFTDWLPMGSSGRGSTHTWPMILRFVQRYEQGLIFVDEVDKAGDDNWTRYLQLELFNLLDRKIPANILDDDIDDDDDFDKRRQDVEQAQEKLRSSFLIVGAGAFQALHDQRSTEIGFTKSAPPKIELNDLAAALPRELVNRFRAELIAIPPLTREDYLDLLRRSVAKMLPPVARACSEIGRATLESAFENQQGVRWLEEIALDAVIAVSSRPANYLSREESNQPDSTK